MLKIVLLMNKILHELLKDKIKVSHIEQYVESLTLRIYKN